MGMDNGIFRVPHHKLNRLTSETGDDLSPYYDGLIDDLGKIYAAMLTDNVNIDGEIAPLYDYYYYVSK